MAKSDTAIAETITYVPGQHDPVHVKWCGHTFQANVPKEIKGDPEGTTSEKLNAQLIESARGNPHFTVGVGAKATRAPRAKEPTDVRSYRAYFINWLKEERDGAPTFETAEQLIARFAQDRDLQAKCELGPDDFAFIGDLFMPKLHELAKHEGLAEAQIAAIWVNHGYMQLPW